MIQAQTGRFSALLLSDMASGATASATFDTKGAHYATLLINAKTDGGTSDATGLTISLTEGDTTASFATFDANFALTGQAIGTTPTDIVLHVSRGAAAKRFLKLAITSGTNATHDSAVVGAIGMLTRLDDRPAGTADMATVVVIG